MTRRVYLYFALTFLLGAVVGSVGLLFYGWYSGHWHHHFDKGRIVRRLTRELDLTEPQAQQLNAILDDYTKKREELEKQVGPQYEALREANRNRVRQILTPDQLAKFNELIRRHDERRKKLTGR